MRENKTRPRRVESPKMKILVCAPPLSCFAAQPILPKIMTLLKMKSFLCPPVIAGTKFTIPKKRIIVN